MGVKDLHVFGGIVWGRIASEEAGLTKLFFLFSLFTGRQSGSLLYLLLIPFFKLHLKASLTHIIKIKQSTKNGTFRFQTDLQNVNTA